MVVFTNARVFDGTQALPGLKTVTIDGNRIASVSDGPADGDGGARAVRGPAIVRAPRG